MTQESPVIVLRSIRYSDASLIVHLYSEKHGAVSALATGLHGRRAKLKPAHLLPLSIHSLVLKGRDEKGLLRMSDLSFSLPLPSLHTDPVKQAIAFFIAELLDKTLRSPQPDVALFAFLRTSIEQLEWGTSETANFPAWFMVRYAQYLGFRIRNNYSDQLKLFDVNSAGFAGSDHPGSLLPPAESNFLARLLVTDYTDLAPVKASSQIRFNTLGCLLGYYRMHLDAKIDVKSLEVLHEVIG